MEGERKIGEVFEYNGVKLIVRKMSSWGDCRRCFFGKKGNINFVDRDLAVSIVYGDNQYDFTIEPITLKALAYAYKLHCEECDEKYNKV